MNALPTLHAAAPAVEVAAAVAPQLDGIKNIIFAVVGTIIICLLAIRLFGAWARRAWGEFASEIVAVLLVGYVAWFPDSATQTLKDTTQGIWGA